MRFELESFPVSNFSFLWLFTIDDEMEFSYFSIVIQNIVTKLPFWLIDTGCIVDIFLIINFEAIDIDVHLLPDICKVVNHVDVSISFFPSFRKSNLCLIPIKSNCTPMNLVFVTCYKWEGPSRFQPW